MLLVRRTYKQLETVPKAVPVSHFGRVTVLFQGTWVSMLTYAWSSSLQSNHLPQTSSPATLGRKRHALCTIFTLYNVSIINVSTAPISRIKRKKNRLNVHGKFKIMFLTTCKNSHTVMSRLRNGITNVFEQPDNVLSSCMLFYNSSNIGKYFFISRFLEQS